MFQEIEGNEFHCEKEMCTSKVPEMHEKVGLKPIRHCDTKCLRWGLALVWTPYTNALGIPTCWYLKTQQFALPDTKPPTRCVPNAKFLALGMYILYLFCQFHLRWVAYFQWNMGLIVRSRTHPFTDVFYGRGCSNLMELLKTS